MLHTLLAAGLLGQPVGPAADWKLDELTLANGQRLGGLILDEGPAGVRFVWVRRQPGRPTVTLTTSFQPREIASAVRLPDADRAALREKLAELDAARGGERARADALELAPADWPGRPGGGRRYRSELFVLTTDAPDEVARLAAVRLEQIYTAYARVLPPRAAGGRPTEIFLAADRDGYRRLLGPAAGPLLHPAVFDPHANRIVCGTDLRPLGAELAAARFRAAQQLAKLDRYEAEVGKLYKDSRAERDRHLAAAAEQRRRVRVADAANARRLEAETGRLFPLLYHETFHAYAGNFVYPPLAADAVRAGAGTGELPRWLNEGLAQIFETAVLDGSELRVGHADRDRLARAQELLKGKGGLVPVADLLRAGRDEFLAAHADQRAAADRTYLTSWAAAFDLAFDRRLVGTAPFHAYLAEVNGGGDPVRAFERLVGQDVPAFERDLHAYLARLQPDGTVRK
jgi:hypothetical protein